MIYRTETRTVYVTEDGQEFGSEKEAKRHTSFAALSKDIGYSFAATIAECLEDKTVRMLVREMLDSNNDPSKPNAEGWIEWTEEDLQANVPPMPYGELLCVKLADGSCIDNYPSNFYWGKIALFPGSEIVAYRVISD